jgi:hypothetical protein
VKPPLVAVIALASILSGCGGWHAQADGHGEGYDVYRPEPYLLIVFGTIADGANPKSPAANDVATRGQKLLSSVEAVSKPSALTAEAVDARTKAQLSGLLTDWSAQVSAIADAQADAQRARTGSDDKLTQDVQKLTTVLDAFKAKPDYTERGVTNLLNQMSETLTAIIADATPPASVSYTAKIIYLPDFASRYRVTSSPSLLGSAESQFSFSDGWELTSLNSKSDNSAALTALTSVIGSLTGAPSAKTPDKGAAKLTGAEAMPGIEQSFRLYKFIFDSQGHFRGLARIDALTGIPDAFGTSYQFQPPGADESPRSSKSSRRETPGVQFPEGEQLRHAILAFAIPSDKVVRYVKGHENTANRLRGGSKASPTAYESSDELCGAFFREASPGTRIIFKGTCEDIPREYKDCTDTNDPGPGVTFRKDTYSFFHHCVPNASSSMECDGIWDVVGTKHFYPTTQQCSLGVGETRHEDIWDYRCSKD